MKTILLIISILTLLVMPSFAADVVITITIPDAYVSRVADAVANIDCNVYDEYGEIIDTLNPKDCLERKIKNELIEFVNICEQRIAKQNAQDAYDSYYQDWLDNYVPIPVQ